MTGYDSSVETTQNAVSGRRRRWWRRVALALVAVEILYLVAANLLLNTDRGHAWLERRPEKLSFEWSAAWTWLPGLFHVRDLELSGRARRATWTIAAESARTWIWLPSLASRHVRLLSVTATGVGIDIDPLPPPEEPRPLRMKRGWRTTLHRVEAESLSRLRFGRQVLHGEGSLRGSASFEIRGPMEFDVSRLRWRGGRFEVDGATAAEQVALDVALTVAPVTPGEGMLAALLSAASGTLAVESETSSLRFVTYYLKRFPWIDLGGEGHLQLEAALRAGRLLPGSRLDFEGSRVTASYLGLSAVGSGRLAGRVPDGGDEVRLAAELDRFEVASLLEGVPLVIGENLAVTAVSDSAAIDHPAEGVEVEAVMPKATVPDLRAVDPYIPESIGLAVTGGEAEMSAEFDYSARAGSGSGWLEFEGRRVEARFDEDELEGEVLLEARFPSMNLQEGRLALDGTRLEVTRARGVGPLAPGEEGWWGRVQISEGSLLKNFGEKGTPAILDGRLDAQLLDTTPVTTILRDRVPRLSWFDELLTVERVDLSSLFRLQGAEVGLSELELFGGEHGRLKLDAELDLAVADGAREIEGVLLAVWGPLSAAVELGDGGRDWKLTRSKAWYREQAERYRQSRR